MLWEKERFVKIRKLVKVAGMIKSFYLAMGNMRRFLTRGMMSQMGYVTERYGWNGGMKIDERVVFELKF